MQKQAGNIDAFAESLHHNLTVKISPLWPTVQAQVGKLGGLVDAEAARADYSLHTADQK